MQSFYQEFNKTKSLFFFFFSKLPRMTDCDVIDCFNFQGRNYVGDILTDIGKNVVPKKKVLQTWSIMKIHMF